MTVTLFTVPDTLALCVHCWRTFPLERHVTGLKVKSVQQVGGGGEGNVKGGVCGGLGDGTEGCEEESQLDSAGPASLGSASLRPATAPPIPWCAPLS